MRSGWRIISTILLRSSKAATSTKQNFHRLHPVRTVRIVGVPGPCTSLFTCMDCGVEASQKRETCAGTNPVSAHHLIVAFVRPPIMMYLAFNCVPYFHVLATCCVTCSSFQAQDVRLESTLCNPSQICCAKSKRNNPCKYVVLLHSAKLSPLKKYQGQRPLRSSHLSRKRAQCSRNHGSTAPFYTEVRNSPPTNTPLRLLQDLFLTPSLQARQATQATNTESQFFDIGCIQQMQKNDLHQSDSCWNIPAKVRRLPWLHCQVQDCPTLKIHCIHRIKDLVSTCSGTTIL